MIKIAVLCMFLAVASGQFRRISSFRRSEPQRSLPRQQTFTHVEESFNPVQEFQQSFTGRDHVHRVPEKYVIVPILRYDSHGPLHGIYNFDFETGDGTIRQEEGNMDGPGGSVVKRGSWSNLYPDGSRGDFSFVSDVHGYRVESPRLPVGPAIPAHSQAQIEKAERERAAGITHDGFYDHARYGGPGVDLTPIPLVRRNQQRRRFN